MDNSKLSTLLKTKNITDMHYKILNDKQINMNKEPIYYWMQGAQRFADNKALTIAGKLANELNRPLIVAFNFIEDFPEGNFRHFSFMYDGIKEISQTAEEYNLGIVISRKNLVDFFQLISQKAALIVTDQGFLKYARDWREKLADEANIPVLEVASNTVVPVKVASDKEEYAAYTIRKKINNKLKDFLVTWEMPRLAKSGVKYNAIAKNFANKNKFLQGLGIKKETPPLNKAIMGGYEAAYKTLIDFKENKLINYHKRNDPDLNITSGLSPYLHFGHISPREVALEIKSSQVATENKEEFLEELIIRRELSHNFVFYNDDYADFPEFLPDWAVKTLQKHSSDKREILYNRDEFAKARTHDIYWNAAQLELIHSGKMHNYMRMYWGKKILEWSSSPAKAFNIALALNNKYALDGRDPNSYAGIGWCFGKHDRAWKERKIYGKVRYMNRNGLERKFSLDQYLARIKNLIPANDIPGQ